MIPPLVGVEEKVTEVPEHILLIDGEIYIDGETFAFTVIVISLLDALAGKTKDALLFKMQETTSLFFKVSIIKEGLFIPMLFPLMNRRSAAISWSCIKSNTSTSTNCISSICCNVNRWYRI